MLIDLTNINVVAVLVAAVLPFAIGFLWYGKPLFGKAWQKEVGLSDKDLKGADMSQTFSISLLSNVIMAITLSAVFNAIVLNPNPLEGFLTGLVLGVGIAAPALLVNYLFAQRSYKHWAIDAGYMVVNLAFIGLGVGLLD